MGSDKMACSENRKVLIKDPKMFYAFWNGQPEFLVGCSGNLRVLNLLKYNSDIISDDPLTEDPYFNIVNYLIPKYREVLEENGSHMEYDNGQSEMDSMLIICHKGKIFTVDFNFGISETFDNFESVGSGEEVAIGAIEVLTKDKSLTPEKIIEETLKIVSKHIYGVSKEYDILMIGP